MGLQRLGVSPFLEEDEAIRFFGIPMYAVEQATGLSPRSFDVVEAELEQRLDLSRSGEKTSSDEDHLTMLSRGPSDRLG